MVPFGYHNLSAIQVTLADTVVAWMIDRVGQDLSGAAVIECCLRSEDKTGAAVRAFSRAAFDSRRATRTEERSFHGSLHKQMENKNCSHKS